jgi:hypothetical protein
MSALAERVITVDRAAGSQSYRMWIPLMGALWVATNVILLAVGTQISYPMSCSFGAGIINGTILSVIAVAKASERFQAGTTGLLGGFTLSGLRSDGSMVWKGVRATHTFIDNALVALGINGGEKFHQAIEQEMLYMIWTMLLVVLASLMAEWVRTVKAGE